MSLPIGKVELKEEEVVHLNNYCVETSKVTGMDYTPLKKTAGVHHLNGVQTVAYARIRYTAGNDFRRAARQREVIYKIVEKAKNADVATLSKILDKVFPNIYTSFSKAEILQMLMLEPKLAILDETDSGLDVDAVRTVSKGIQLYKEKCKGSLLIITHSTRILESLHVDVTHVMDEGKVVMEGTPRKIFSRVEELKQLRLDVPQVTELAYELSRSGVPIRSGILTNQELIDELMKLK